MLQKKWLIICTTALFTLGAILVALVLPPKYEVKSHLSEPTADKFQALLINADLNINAADLFEKFVNTLAQKENFISYLSGTSKAEEVTNAAKDGLHFFDQEALNYKVNILPNGGGIHKDKNIAVELLTFLPTLDLKAINNKSYIEYTNHKVLQNLIMAQKSVIQRKITQLQEKTARDIAVAAAMRLHKIKRLTDKQELDIANLKNRMEALARRDLRDNQIRLFELENALKTAQALGIHHYDPSQKMSSQNVIINVRQSGSDLYLKGTEYLQKEIALIKANPHSVKYQKQISALQQKLFLVQNNREIIALKNRADDMPYAPNINAYKNKLKYFKTLSFDTTGVVCFNFEGEPQVDLNPKPKKQLIILLGSLLGLILSMLFVFFRTPIVLQKETSVKI